METATNDAVRNEAASKAAARRRSVEDVLFREASDQDGRLQVYAIVDPAQDDRIYYEMHRDARAYACLYAGKIAPELAVAAPYVVPLDRGARFTDRLLSLMWGRNGGVFAISRVPLEEMRRHLRRFLIVANEDGGRMYFRWYDPRVLRPYLRTCTSRELEYVFGPIQRWVIEGEEPDALLEMTRIGSRGAEALRTDLVRV